MTVGALVGLIVIDLLIIITISVGTGAIAPRFDDRRLMYDRFLLRLWPMESTAGYRKWKIPFLAQHLPELGTVFGGQSKAVLVGTDPQSLQRYLFEVRRAEIVHWVSFLSWLPLVFFNPWWLTLAFAVIVMAGNGIYIAILRNNRIRLLRIISRQQ
jgi:hypothetical protein